MNIPILTSLIVLNSGVILGQIKNNDFEFSRDTVATLPKDWSIKKIIGFDFGLDKEIKYSGANSFNIKSTQTIDSNKFIPFSQVVNFDVQNFKKIAITVYIKSKDITGNAGLWCQIWNKDDKQIGFQNLELQKTKIIGTTDWKKYSISLVVNSNCKKLLLGGYLQGTGSVWYDNFSIENLEFASTPPSKEAKEYIDGFCKIIKKQSVYSNSINWKILQAEIELISKGANSIEDATVVSSHILNKLRELGDNHSFILSKKSYDRSLKTNLDERRPYGKLLENNIGYVYVPGYASTNDTVSENFATSIQNIIKDLDTKNNITGWIVDLRENTGGNMYPMITGLGPIIGEGTLGHFHNANGKVRTRWLYSNGSTRVVKVKAPYVLKNSAVKVAVLIGPNTSSSGEMTAISFVGKPNTKFFGQPSGGYTTGNSMFKLKDGTALALATSYVSDRNKNKYLSKINPDVFVNTDNDAIKIAEQWLNEK